MKKIIAAAMLSILLMASFAQISSAQAPEDLSFLTNRASLASWALKQVNEIEVNMTQSAAGSPENGIPVESRSIVYAGMPSFTAMAKALNGQKFVAVTPIADSVTIVSIFLKGSLPDGNKQYLFGGSASGKAVFDGNNWRLPKEASEPNMYLNYSVFIPAKGVVKAWVVETNQWGWAMKKSLNVSYDQGFYFESSLAEEAFLCLEFIDSNVKGGGTVQYVYDLHAGGRRAPLLAVIAMASIRDSEDVRDYNMNNVENPTDISHWVYTHKPENSTMTYGKVPLMVANYTKATAVNIWVGSSVGYARKFVVTRVPDVRGGPEARFVLDIPAGLNYYGHVFKPGLYHIVPLGIDVSADWWKILEVNGWGGKG